MAPPPPGRRGLPFLGETLSFLADPHGFIERGIAQHGGPFRTRILGNTTCFVAGPDACGLWLDEDCIERKDSFPPNFLVLFGGESLPMLDGAVHRVRKALMLHAFDEPAVESYTPLLGSIISRYVQRWRGAGELRWVDELKSLATEGICAITGLEPGPELEGVLRDYGLVFDALAALPIPLPGTAYSRGRAAVARLLGVYARLTEAHRAEPRDDGLTRLITAEVDGQRLSDEQIGLEVHHAVLAGFIIFAEFAATIVALTDSPEVRERLTAEVDEHAPTGEITAEQLAAMPYLDQVVMEVKRWCVNVPIAFGRARRDFDFAGYTFPKGWNVYLSPTPCNRWSEHFAEPLRFDPERFGERAEHKGHEHAFVPQGPGDVTRNHRCLGELFSTRFMALFAALLVRDCDWTLVETARPLPMKVDRIPPEPADGLRATVS